jgi:hypothetical protein
MWWNRTKEINNSEPDLRDFNITQDMNWLREAFYQSLDRSRLESMLRQGESRFASSESVLTIGEGTHFRAYLVQPHSSDRQGVVVAIAKPSFLTGSGLNRLSRWRQAMKTVKAQKLELMPPHEILTISDQCTALVTPYGESARTGAKSTWLPLEKFEQLTIAKIAQSGLIMRDGLQIRCMQGIPFIHDWSDLDYIVR